MAHMFQHSGTSRSFRISLTLIEGCAWLRLWVNTDPLNIKYAICFSGVFRSVSSKCLLNKLYQITTRSRFCDVQAFEFVKLPRFSQFSLLGKGPSMSWFFLCRIGSCENLSVQGTRSRNEFMPIKLICPSSIRLSNQLIELLLASMANIVKPSKCQCHNSDLPSRVAKLLK